MTDDELPPLPELHSNVPMLDAVGLYAYIRAYARNFARLAIEQDRARPVPGEERIGELIDALTKACTDFIATPIENEQAVALGFAFSDAEQALRAAIRQALRQPAARTEALNEAARICDERAEYYKGDDDHHSDASPGRRVIACRNCAEVIRYRAEVK